MFNSLTDRLQNTFAELRGKGLDVLVDAHDEPWGQTTSRLITPEGLLLGISHTPWMHQPPE